MIVDYISLGKAIARRRHELGLTQEQLAEHCNLSTSHISCIERASRKASLESLISLCRALSVSPNWLLQASLPDCTFNALLDTPLKLREPDLSLRNTLTNWYFADLPDESLLSDTPVSASELSKLEFTLLGEDFPSNIH